MHYSWLKGSRPRVVARPEAAIASGIQWGGVRWTFGKGTLITIATSLCMARWRRLQGFRPQLEVAAGWSSTDVPERCTKCGSH